MPQPPSHRLKGSGLTTCSSLIDRLRASDAAGWERLVVLYSPLLRHWAKRNGVALGDSEDVCQEVFARVVELIDSFRLGDRPGSFRAWLRSITWNICRERQRSNGPVNQASGGTDAAIQLSELADPVADDNDPPELIAELHRRVMSLVQDEFSERDWVVFHRLVIENQSTAEVAVDMDLTGSNLRKIKSRVLLRLRQELGEVRVDDTATEGD